jgi:hypothetical protein
MARASSRPATNLSPPATPSADPTHVNAGLSPQKSRHSTAPEGHDTASVRSSRTAGSGRAPVAGRRSWLWSREYSARWSGRRGAEARCGHGVLGQDSRPWPDLRAAPEEVRPSSAGSCRGRRRTPLAHAGVPFPHHFLGGPSRDTALSSRAVLQVGRRTRIRGTPTRRSIQTVRRGSRTRELGLDVTDAELEDEQPGQGLARVLGRVDRLAPPPIERRSPLASDSSPRARPSMGRAWGPRPHGGVAGGRVPRGVRARARHRQPCGPWWSTGRPSTTRPVREGDRTQVVLSRRARCVTPVRRVESRAPGPDVRRQGAGVECARPSRG